jgi:adenylate cyclase
MYLSLVYQDEYLFDHNPRPDSLNRGLHAARRAMDADPAVGRLALARALYALRDPAFFEQAERLIAMNPYDAEAFANLGMYTAWAGRWDRGIAVARKALQLDPNLPGWAYITIQTHYYRKGEYERALEYARKIDMPEYYWNWAHLAIDYAQLDRKEEARSAARELLRLYPTFPQNARRELNKWAWEEEFVDHIIDGLRKAGLDIPPD